MNVIQNKENTVYKENEKKAKTEQRNKIKYIQYLHLKVAKYNV